MKIAEMNKKGFRFIPPMNIIPEIPGNGFLRLVKSSIV